MAAVRYSAAIPLAGVTGGHRPEAVAHGPPNRSQKSIEAAVQVAATRRLNLLRLDAYNGGQRIAPPACQRAATLASAPARKCDDKRAEQPVAAGTARLARITDPTTLAHAVEMAILFKPTLG
jgi:hypothetical protein